MTSEQFSRTALLIGEDGVKRLQKSKVALFGLGGVGGYCLEALCRSGVGEMHLIDSDVLSESNLNRQILATWKDLGRYKVDVARERVLEINPAARVFTYPLFFGPDTAGELDFSRFDYVVDAIDTVTRKIALILLAREKGCRVISCMGAGNKMDPTAFKVSDIYESRVCPLARVMRRELRKRGVENLKVVYSLEEPLEIHSEKSPSGKPIPGSNAFVPAVAGLILAGEVVRDLTGEERA